ncbi:MAG: Sulfide-quinone reductase [Candidatus Dichloromethanomonas elyunquensis]|nr:MAG: Sulfide-quinone reductase [Candidatus Dichloromethanomonas elyunquensis]
MSRVVIIGSGFAGQTAALFVRKWLGSEHEVHVISAARNFQYTPSLIWVGTGNMDGAKTQFPLEPVYRCKGIKFTHGKVTEINIEEKTVSTEDDQSFPYDYLINASGARLNFEATPGLGPDTGNTVSVCTRSHAEEARDQYFNCIKRMEAGEEQTIVIGTGHATSTCQGAAFEYIQNIHFDLVSRNLRDRCRLIWFTNEPKLGDLGMGGFVFNVKNELRSSEELTEWLMKDCGIETMVERAPVKVEAGKIYWEDVHGNEGVLEFDMAMLIPQFTGQKIKFTNKAGEDLTSQYCAPSGLMKVDADYTSAAKDPTEWRATDWPKRYQSPLDPHLFAAGIAFAPPHPVSFPSGVTKGGIKIHAAPPRTGMVCGIIGRAVAENVVSLVKGENKFREISMSHMPAACVASRWMSVWSGSAIMVAIYPVVPDFERYSEEHGGRDMTITTYEIGKANAWIKRILHTMFIYKLKGNLGWSMIPE